ncbi:MAG: isochorismatase family protein [Deltaproteobacteria bacterium]|nr:isochorismatase family protein [Deltaproteobacteria bacterium]
MSAGILLVDPQYDFFPGGSLAVAEGDQIVEPINDLIARHAELGLYASRDWHPPSTKHFKERGGIWPPHCVQETHGAQFHEGLRMSRAAIYDKGTNPDDDGGYSAFEGSRDGRALIDDLRRDQVDTLIIAGLATDYCVKASALDARKLGLTVFLFVPGVRAVNLKPDDGAAALALMREAGVLLAS